MKYILCLIVDALADIETAFFVPEVLAVVSTFNATTSVADISLFITT